MRKVLGIVPARMAASRFPGKPLHPILGRPMIEHVFLRAQMYRGWDRLVLATCDSEIERVAMDKGMPVVMTSDEHTRALDRVAEAVTLLDVDVSDDDIVVCVQGDEPMLRPDMIEAVVNPLLEAKGVLATVLSIHITDEDVWMNPDTVKLVHNAEGQILYTSRAPIPYCKGAFSAEHMARRVGGIFAFYWKYLREFTAHPETRLEQLESCDSNRVLDMQFRQYIAPYPDIRSHSVDSPGDIAIVERHMVNDKYWALYS